jgi:hypothetical protein
MVFLHIDILSLSQCRTVPCYAFCISAKGIAREFLAAEFGIIRQAQEGVRKNVEIDIFT